MAGQQLKQGSKRNMKALEAFKHVYLVGIGGSGMSAIARIMLSMGLRVSGADLSTSATTRLLASEGATIYQHHHAENLEGVDLLVISTAIRPTNPERCEAERRGIEIWHRADVLSAIMARNHSVAVSGTHGKTTTTSMLGLMLWRAGIDPTVLIGGELNDFGGNARSGKGEWTVAEADESDASFLKMYPDRIIITNVEADHLDFYRDLNHIKDTFNRFVGNLREGGKVIACLDQPVLAQLIAEKDWPEVLTYSIERRDADMRAEHVEVLEDGRMRFVPVWRGEVLPAVSLQVPGVHNVLNALAALTCGLDLGISVKGLIEGLEMYTGAKRRFQLKGCERGITVIDDYAHHPTEIAATLRAARDRFSQPEPRRIVGLFQPHRYSRTARFIRDFGRVLCNTDVLLVTDVYSAGEDPIAGVDAQAIVKQARAAGHTNAHYLPTLDDCRNWLLANLCQGDAMLTLGAGNVYTVGESVLEGLNERKSA